MTRDMHRLISGICFLFAFAVSGCSTHESVKCEPCHCDIESSPMDGSLRFEETLPDMTAALQLFGVAEESALRSIVELAESPEHEKRLRLCDMSEQEWVAHWGGEWERQRDILTRRLTHLRFLARQLVDRAIYLNSAGEQEKAVKILTTVKRLGAANRGPGVPLVCDIVGKAIEELVDKNLAAISK